MHVEDSVLSSKSALEAPIISTEICDEIELECYFCDHCSEEFKTEADWKKHKLRWIKVFLSNKIKQMLMHCKITAEELMLL